MRSRIATLMLCLLATACAEDRQVYAGSDFELQYAPPSTASFESDRIQIVAGEAVKVRVLPRSSGELDYSPDDLLSVRPQIASILEVYSTEREHEFVFVANEPGQTCVEVIINRRREDCVDVRVTPPVLE